MNLNNVKLYVLSCEKSTRLRLHDMKTKMKVTARQTFGNNTSASLQISLQKCIIYEFTHKPWVQLSEWRSQRLMAFLFYIYITSMLIMYPCSPAYVGKLDEPSACIYDSSRMYLCQGVKNFSYSNYPQMILFLSTTVVGIKEWTLINVFKTVCLNRLIR